MISKMKLSPTETFPWFEPTVHSWFESRWNESEADDIKALGEQFKSTFNTLLEQNHELYTLCDGLTSGGVYKDTIKILKELFAKDISSETVNRIYKEIHTELCTRSIISDNKLSFKCCPQWYDTFLENGCVPLRIDEEDIENVVRHITADIENLVKQGEVWKGVGYDNERRYERSVDRELYSDLDKIFFEYDIINAAELYFNHTMVLDGVTLHVCKSNDRHWQMTMADHTPTEYENLHFDPKTGMMKCIFYLSDVTQDDGPFSYIEGSHRWKDDPFNRIVAKAIAVTNYLENDEKREEFLRLPRSMQKCANIGAFLQKDVHDLFTQERKYTSDDGNIFFFDPGGLHRGGITASEGMRVNLQIMFRLAHNGKTVPFI